MGFIVRANAQDVDYNTIILPGNLTNISIEEKLVQLAWRNTPDNKSVIKQAEAANYMLKKSQWAWLDYIRVQGNLNEFTLKKSVNVDTDNNPRANFYPRYNFGIYMTLGAFAQVPLEVKQRRVELKISENNINQQKLNVRAEILRRYNLYLLAKEKLDIQRNIEQDSYANYKLVEQQFKNGEQNVQVYNNILERYTAQRLNKLQAETEFKNSKINVEQMIGLRLEDVISN
jgi:outer membrane protein TolC